MNVPGVVLTYFILESISSEECFTTFTGDGVEVVAERLVAAHGALLGRFGVLQSPQRVRIRFHFVCQRKRFQKLYFECLDMIISDPFVYQRRF